MARYQRKWEGAFCTMIPSGKGGGRLNCRFLSGDSFSTDAIESRRIHWRGPGFRTWLLNADGQATFCTAAGSRDEFVDCMIVRENKFGKEDLIEICLNIRPSWSQNFQREATVFLAGRRLVWILLLHLAMPCALSANKPASDYVAITKGSSCNGRTHRQASLLGEQEIGEKQYR